MFARQDEWKSATLKKFLLQKKAHSKRWSRIDFKSAHLPVYDNPKRKFCWFYFHFQCRRRPLTALNVSSRDDYRKKKTLINILLSDSSFVYYYAHNQQLRSCRQTSNGGRIQIIMDLSGAWRVVTIVWIIPFPEQFHLNKCSQKCEKLNLFNHALLRTRSLRIDFFSLRDCWYICFEFKTIKPLNIVWVDIMT